MRSIVLSVPHSGTRFVHEHMNTESYHHTWDKWECMVENCKTADHIYVAMRHPKDVRMSWIRRGVLHNKRSIYRWYMSWYQLQACDELFDLDVICVDKQEDPRIKNWEKIGAESHEMPMPGQFQDVYWDILFHLPIVARNYEYG